MNLNNIDLVHPEIYRIKDRFGVRSYRRNVPNSTSSALIQEEEKPKIQNNLATGFGEQNTCTPSVRLAACGANYDGDEPPCGTIEDDDEEYEITFNDKFNNFCTKFAVAKDFHKHIIGRQADTKKRLENQTRTRIDVPRIGMEGDIVITGSIRANVASCRRRIEMLVDSARLRQPFTHFIGLPFNSEEIVKNFNEFKQLVLGNCFCARGLDVSIFQAPERLHLTVGMLVLLSNAERTLAKQTLEQCKTDIIMPRLANVPMPLKARLKGLNYMNDDPSEAHVLYGNVEPIGGWGLNTLQDLANQMVDFFVRKNVMPRKQYEAVKLHVTLMNTRYRNNDDDEEDGNGNGASYQSGFGRASEERNVGNTNRESFDARPILEKYVDFDFGVQTVKEIHILQRHARPDGYYITTAKIDLC